MYGGDHLLGASRLDGGVIRDKLKLSILYPAFNEEQNVKNIPVELLPYIEKLGIPYEVIIIDDGSKDNTLNEAIKLKIKYPVIRVLKHKKNMGLGAAVKTGIKNAKGELLVTIDGDFTFHPRQIKDLFKRFQKGDVDCVIGSPTLKGYGKDVPSYRIFLSKSVNLLYNILLGKRITAVSPIFRLYKTRQLKKLKIQANGFDINAEILFRLLEKNRIVTEIPARLTTRKFGESKLNNVKEIKNHIKLLLRILSWKIKG
ncbi:MAG: glycosyltransferase family 2 protein [Candidatus Woesearchaeota archaeon]